MDTELLNHVEARGGGKFDATSSPLFCFSILTARHRAASRSPGERRLAMVERHRATCSVCVTTADCHSGPADSETVQSGVAGGWPAPL